MPRPPGVGGAWPGAGGRRPRSPLASSSRLPSLPVAPLPGHSPRPRSRRQGGGWPRGSGCRSQAGTSHRRLPRSRDTQPRSGERAGPGPGDHGGSGPARVRERGERSAGPGAPGPGARAAFCGRGLRGETPRAGRTVGGPGRQRGSQEGGRVLGLSRQRERQAGGPAGGRARPASLLRPTRRSQRPPPGRTCRGTRKLRVSHALKAGPPLCRTRRACGNRASVSSGRSETGQRTARRNPGRTAQTVLPPPCTARPSAHTLPLHHAGTGPTGLSLSY